MAGSLLPQPKQLFQDANWNPLIGGQIFTYAAGTLTPKATYQDMALTIANTNPTIANSRGELLMFGTGAYRIILKDSMGNTIYDVDNIESSRSIVDSLRADIAAASGSNLMGYASPSASTPSQRTTQEKLGERISILDYNGADKSGNNDNGALIQKAVNEAAQHGIYIVDVPGTFRSEQSIVVPGGVTLSSGVSPGYYAGMPYYAIPVNTKTGPKGRIIAGKAISGGLVTFDDSLDNNFGFGLKNVIIDGNKMADFAIAFNPATLTERITRIKDVICQGGVLGGIQMSRVLVQFWDNVTVSACGGFGVQFPFGVSDSQFKGLYIHTCDQGAMRIGDGSANLHFFGGKWEDNYGNGLEVTVTTTGVLVFLHGVSINSNNGDAISNNGGGIYGDGCAIFSHNISLDSAAVYCAAGVVKLSGGVIYGNNYNFQQTGGSIAIDGVEISNSTSGNVIQTAGTLSVIADTKNAIPAMRNPGARRIAVSIGTSSSVSITFANALDGGMGPAYFDMKAYDLSVTYAQFPSAPDPSQSFIGQVIVGKTAGAINAAIRVISASTAPYIASVAASVSGSDIIITITTGASYGTGGGNTTSYVSLADIGHNIYH